MSTSNDIKDFAIVVEETLITEYGIEGEEIDYTAISESVLYCAEKIAFDLGLQKVA